MSANAPSTSPHDGTEPVGAVPSLLRRLNTRCVLDTLLHQGPCTRAELARQTAISAPTVSKLVDRMLQAGLIEEDRKLATTRGRPGKRLQLAKRNSRVLGIAVDVEKITYVHAGLDGAVDPHEVQSAPTPDTYPAFLDLLQEIVETTAREKTRLLDVGLSFPGLIERGSHRIEFSPNLPFLNGQSPGAELQEKTRLDVVTRHELHGLCLAERMTGGAEAVRDFAIVDISGGFGVGVMSDGQFLRGRRGFGGELGHITVVPEGKLCGCGNRGCLETVATDTSFLRAVAEKAGEPLSIDQIIERTRSGELDIRPELEELCQFLSIGLAAVINIFNPSHIFLYSNLFRVSPSLLTDITERTMHRALTPSARDCRLMRTRADKTCGAVATAIDHLWNLEGPTFG